MSSRFSFEVVNALDYDELRPSYAPDAVAWVAERSSLRSGSVVVDLAAGTGQLSRRFAPLDVDLIAVEPAANMRAVLADRVPTVRIEEGTAEAIPCADRSVDAVVVGNAFHHFERHAAFAEIHRVLRPGGVLALFWAWPLEEEHLSIPGMREIDHVVEAMRASNEIATAYRSWSDVPSTAAGFGPFERREFSVTQCDPVAPSRRSLRNLERRGVAAGAGEAGPSRSGPQSLERAARDAAHPGTNSRRSLRTKRRGDRRRRERVRGIEPPFRAWEARVLPLNHTRVGPPPRGGPTV